MVIWIGVGLGVLVLWIFYRVVESNWPDSYFALQDITSLEISASLPRYLIFRFLPVALASLFVAVSVEQLLGRGVLAGSAVAVIHAILTAGRGFASALGTRRLNRVSLLLAHGLVFLGVVATGVLAGLFSRTEGAKYLVPDVSQVASDLWTALLAGILGAFLVKITSGRELPEGVLLQRLRERLPDNLREYARKKAEEVDADPDLVEAVMIAENMQRPRWFRQLERIKGIVFGSGTYGILQIHSNEPLSDKESVDLALNTRFAGRQFQEPDGGLRYSELENFVADYNSDPDYIQLVVDLYEASHY